MSLRPSSHRPTAALALLCAGLTTAPASDRGWLTDWEAAKRTAAVEKKDLLVNFTGSDWCSWCQRLDKEVFSEPAFMKQAPEKYIFVLLDFPQQRDQPEPEKIQNRKLQEQFAVQGFPTVFLADSEGRPYARTGYQDGGAQAYLDHLAKISAPRLARDKAFAAAAKTEGVEKAFHLKAALDALADDLGSIPVYADMVKQIDELDKDDSLGFRKAAAERTAAQNLENELTKLVEEDKRDEIFEKVDSFLATHPLEGEAKQRILLMKRFRYGRDDTEPMARLLDEVIAVDPKSEVARQAQSLKERLTTVRLKPKPPTRPK